MALIRDSLSRRLTVSVTPPFSFQFFLQLMLVFYRFREQCAYHKADGEKREFFHDDGPYRVVSGPRAANHMGECMAISRQNTSPTTTEIVLPVLKSWASGLLLRPQN